MVNFGDQIQIILFLAPLAFMIFLIAFYECYNIEYVFLINNMAYILEANVFKIQLVYIGIYAVKNYILKKLFIKIYS